MDRRFLFPRENVPDLPPGEPQSMGGGSETMSFPKQSRVPSPVVAARLETEDPQGMPSQDEQDCLHTGKTVCTQECCGTTVLFWGNEDWVGGQGCRGLGIWGGFGWAGGQGGGGRGSKTPCSGQSILRGTSGMGPWPWVKIRSDLGLPVEFSPLSSLPSFLHFPTRRGPSRPEPLPSFNLQAAFRGGRAPAQSAHGWWERS